TAIPFVLALCLARPAQAQTLVFSEDWESGSGNWTVRNTAGPIVIQSDASICSSKYQHETLPASGGRVFTTNGIPATNGTPYCLTAWVRGSVAASPGTEPFIGVMQSDVNGNNRTNEHFLIGHTGYL